MRLALLTATFACLGPVLALSPVLVLAAESPARTVHIQSDTSRIQNQDLIFPSGGVIAIASAGTMEPTGTEPARSAGNARAGGLPIPSDRSHVSPPKVELSPEDLNRSSLSPESDPDRARRIRQALQTYRKQGKRSVRVGLERREDHLPIIEAAFAAQGIPLWLSALAMVESHFNPNARSGAGPAGMWQLQVETARHLGLKVTRDKDERLDPEKSTQAVAKLLRQHYDQFKDWDLTIAAYSSGASRVKRAVKSRPGADLKELVHHGLLPSLLLDRVATVQAAAMIAAYPEVHGFKSTQ